MLSFVFPLSRNALDRVQKGLLPPNKVRWRDGLALVKQRTHIRGNWGKIMWYLKSLMILMAISITPPEMKEVKMQVVVCPRSMSRRAQELEA